MDDIVTGPRLWSARSLPTTAMAVMIALTLTSCGSEASPDRSESTAAKPQGPAHACDQLVGSGGLVSRALVFTKNHGVNGDDNERFEVQNDLFKIVVAGNKQLRAPVGQLVDFLDDPPTYVSSKDLTAKVQSAASRIREICAR